MSPRTSAQLRLHKENKKSAILEAALKVFAHNGFEGATIDKIAREAGMAKGLLYTYYSGKDELLKALIRFGMEKALAYIDANTPGSIKTKKAFEKNLRGMIGYFLQETDFWKLYTLLALQPNVSRQFQKEAKIFFEKYLGIYIDYFRRKRSKNPVAETMLFGAVLDGVLIDLIMMPDEYPVEDVVKMIIAKFA
ncbi:MAG TPA: TetR/AcrR family transcriptional regulator [Chitinophagaceae bacterium]|nr:TetR/AcrR family transcriptional regulator [Chitinophagaceae bacterium]